MENKEKPYWCETCGSDIADGKCKCATPTAVGELDLEERAEMWLQSEYGSTINESPITGHAYIAGWKQCAKTHQSKLVEVVEKRIALLSNINNYEATIQSNEAKLILNLLTKFNPLK